MAIAFGLGAVAYWLLGSLGTAPWAFVLFAALIFLTWGEIFSLFPSTCTDTFGAKFATVNLSLLYTAKGTSAFLVPVANLIKTSTGSWHMVFAATAAMNVVVVALALFVLKPMRRRMMVQSKQSLTQVSPQEVPPSVLADGALHAGIQMANFILRAPAHLAYCIPVMSNRDRSVSRMTSRARGASAAGRTPAIGIPPGAGADRHPHPVSNTRPTRP